MRFWKDVVFDEFLDWQKVGPKFKKSMTLTDNLKKGASFGRVRWRVGEEKELGF